jgi:predicted permease
MSNFTATFFELCLVLLKLLAVIMAAGFLVRKKFVLPKHISFLSKITIDIFLPALIFSKIIQTFKPNEMTYWWIFPLASLGMILIGLIFAIIFFRKEFVTKKYLLAMCALQNATYIVLPIGQLQYPNQFDKFALYVFLFSLGINPALWTLGRYLVTPNSKNSIKTYFSGPMLASVFGVVICLLNLQALIPAIAVKGLDFIGKGGIPLATFVFGATLGSLPLNQIKINFTAIKVASIKLIILPASVFIFIALYKIKQFDPLIASFLIIEASVAQASTLILQIRRYGGEQTVISSIMIVTYLFSLVTLPMWVALLELI